MFCANCGAKVGEGENFCKSCGHKVENNSAPAVKKIATDANASSAPVVTSFSARLAPFQLANLFRGRIGRKNFILGVILTGLAPLALAFGLGFIVGIISYFLTFGEETAISFVVALVMPMYLVSVVIGFGLYIRRLHDINYSGWLCLLFLVPFANLVLLFIVLFKAGTPDNNNYGSKPDQGAKLTTAVFGREVATGEVSPKMTFFKWFLIAYAVYFVLVSIAGVAYIFYKKTQPEDPTTNSRNSTEYEIDESDPVAVMLQQIEPYISPVGRFTRPDVFADESMSNEEWYSYISYSEPAFLNVPEPASARFPKQTQAYSAVVKVVCEAQDYWFFGSGTSFSELGYALTNRHVVEDEYGETFTDCMVGFADPETGLVREVYWATPIVDEASTTGHDLAVLSIEAPVIDNSYNVYGFAEKPLRGTFQHYSGDDFCTETTPKLGEQVFVLGYPPLTGGALTITDGLISSLYSTSGYLITSAKISSGNSGGFAVDTNGCFVGVPTAVYLEEDDEHYGEIIDSAYVDEFFEAIADDLDRYTM